MSSSEDIYLRDIRAQLISKSIPKRRNALRDLVSGTLRAQRFVTLLNRNSIDVIENWREDAPDHVTWPELVLLALGIINLEIVANLEVDATGGPPSARSITVARDTWVALRELLRIIEAQDEGLHEFLIGKVAKRLTLQVDRSKVASSEGATLSAALDAYLDSFNALSTCFGHGHAVVQAITEEGSKPLIPLSITFSCMALLLTAKRDTVVNCYATIAGILTTLHSRRTYAMAMMPLIRPLFQLLSSVFIRPKPTVPGDEHSSYQRLSSEVVAGIHSVHAVTTAQLLSTLLLNMPQPALRVLQSFALPFYCAFFSQEIVPASLGDWDEDATRLAAAAQQHGLASIVDQVWVKSPPTGANRMPIGWRVTGWAARILSDPRPAVSDEPYAPILLTTLCECIVRAEEEESQMAQFENGRKVENAQYVSDLLTSPRDVTSDPGMLTMEVLRALTHARMKISKLPPLHTTVASVCATPQKMLQLPMGFLIKRILVGQWLEKHFGLFDEFGQLQASASDVQDYAHWSWSFIDDALAYIAAAWSPVRLAAHRAALVKLLYILLRFVTDAEGSKRGLSPTSFEAQAETWQQVLNRATLYAAISCSDLASELAQSHLNASGRTERASMVEVSALIDHLSNQTPCLLQYEARKASSGQILLDTETEKIADCLFSEVETRYKSSKLDSVWARACTPNALLSPTLAAVCNEASLSLFCRMNLTYALYGAVDFAGYMVDFRIDPISAVSRRLAQGQHSRIQSGLTTAAMVYLIDLSDATTLWGWGLDEMLMEFEGDLRRFHRSKTHNDRPLLVAKERERGRLGPSMSNVQPIYEIYPDHQRQAYACTAYLVYLELACRCTDPGYWTLPLLDWITVVAKLGSVRIGTSLSSKLQQSTPGRQESLRTLKKVKLDNQEVQETKSGSQPIVRLHLEDVSERSSGVFLLPASFHDLVVANQNSALTSRAPVPGATEQRWLDQIIDYCPVSDILARTIINCKEDTSLTLDEIIQESLASFDDNPAGQYASILDPARLAWIEAALDAVPKLFSALIILESTHGALVSTRILDLLTGPIMACLISASSGEGLRNVVPQDIEHLMALLYKLAQLDTRHRPRRSFAIQRNLSVSHQEGVVGVLTSKALLLLSDHSNDLASTIPLSPDERPLVQLSLSWSPIITQADEPHETLEHKLNAIHQMLTSKVGVRQHVASGDEGKELTSHETYLRRLHKASADNVISLDHLSRLHTRSWNLSRALVDSETDEKGIHSTSLFNNLDLIMYPASGLYLPEGDPAKSQSLAALIARKSISSGYIGELWTELRHAKPGSTNIAVSNLQAVLGAEPGTKILQEDVLFAPPLALTSSSLTVRRQERWHQLDESEQTYTEWWHGRDSIASSVIQTTVSKWKDVLRSAAELGDCVASLQLASAMSKRGVETSTRAVLKRLLESGDRMDISQQQINPDLAGEFFQGGAIPPVYRTPSLLRRLQRILGTHLVLSEPSSPKPLEFLSVLPDSFRIKDDFDSSVASIKRRLAAHLRHSTLRDVVNYPLNSVETDELQKLDVSSLLHVCNEVLAALSTVLANPGAAGCSPAILREAMRAIVPPDWVSEMEALYVPERESEDLVVDDERIAMMEGEMRSKPALAAVAAARLLAASLVLDYFMLVVDLTATACAAVLAIALLITSMVPKGARPHAPAILAHHFEQKLDNEGAKIGIKRIELMFVKHLDVIRLLSHCDVSTQGIPHLKQSVLGDMGLSCAGAIATLASSLHLYALSRVLSFRTSKVLSIGPTSSDLTTQVSDSSIEVGTMDDCYILECVARILITLVLWGVILDPVLCIALYRLLPRVLVESQAIIADMERRAIESSFVPDTYDVSRASKLAFQVHDFESTRHAAAFNVFAKSRSCYMLIFLLISQEAVCATMSEIQRNTINPKQEHAPPQGSIATPKAPRFMPHVWDTLSHRLVSHIPFKDPLKKSPDQARRDQVNPAVSQTEIWKTINSRVLAADVTTDENQALATRWGLTPSSITDRESLTDSDYRGDTRYILLNTGQIVATQSAASDVGTRRGVKRAVLDAPAQTGVSFLGAGGGSAGGWQPSLLKVCEAPIAPEDQQALENTAEFVQRVAQLWREHPHLWGRLRGLAPHSLPEYFELQKKAGEPATKASPKVDEIHAPFAGTLCPPSETLVLVRLLTLGLPSNALKNLFAYSQNGPAEFRVKLWEDVLQGNSDARDMQVPVPSSDLPLLTPPLFELASMNGGPLKAALTKLVQSGVTEPSNPIAFYAALGRMIPYLATAGHVRGRRFGTLTPDGLTTYLRVASRETTTSTESDETIKATPLKRFLEAPNDSWVYLRTMCFPALSVLTACKSVDAAQPENKTDLRERIIKADLVSQTFDLEGSQRAPLFTTDPISALVLSNASEIYHRTSKSTALSFRHSGAGLPESVNLSSADYALAYITSGSISRWRKRLYRGQDLSQSDTVDDLIRVLVLQSKAKLDHEVKASRAVFPSVALSNWAFRAIVATALVTECEDPFKMLFREGHSAHWHDDERILMRPALDALVPASCPTMPMAYETLLMGVFSKLQANGEPGFSLRSSATQLSMPIEHQRRWHEAWEMFVKLELLGLRQMTLGPLPADLITSLDTLKSFTPALIQVLDPTVVGRVCEQLESSTWLAAKMVCIPERKRALESLIRMWLGVATLCIRGERRESCLLPLFLSLLRLVSRGLATSGELEFRLRVVDSDHATEWTPFLHLGGSQNQMAGESAFGLTLTHFGCYVLDKVATILDYEPAEMSEVGAQAKASSVQFSSRTIHMLSSHASSILRAWGSWRHEASPELVTLEAAMTLAECILRTRAEHVSEKTHVRILTSDAHAKYFMFPFKLFPRCQQTDKPVSKDRKSTIVECRLECSPLLVHEAQVVSEDSLTYLGEISPQSIREHWTQALIGSAASSLSIHYSTHKIMSPEQSLAGSGPINSVAQNLMFLASRIRGHGALSSKALVGRYFVVLQSEVCRCVIREVMHGTVEKSEDAFGILLRTVERRCWGENQRACCVCCDFSDSVVSSPAPISATGPEGPPRILTQAWLHRAYYLQMFLLDALQIDQEPKFGAFFELLVARLLPIMSSISRLASEKGADGQRLGRLFNLVEREHLFGEPKHLPVWDEAAAIQFTIPHVWACLEYLIRLSQIGRRAYLHTYLSKASVFSGRKICSVVELLELQHPGSFDADVVTRLSTLWNSDKVAFAIRGLGNEIKECPYLSPIAQGLEDICFQDQSPPGSQTSLSERAVETTTFLIRFCKELAQLVLHPLSSFNSSCLSRNCHCLNRRQLSDFALDYFAVLKSAVRLLMSKHEPGDDIPWGVTTRFYHDHDSGGELRVTCERQGSPPGLSASYALTSGLEPIRTLIPMLISIHSHWRETDSPYKAEPIQLLASCLSSFYALADASHFDGLQEEASGLGVPKDVPILPYIVSALTPQLVCSVTPPAKLPQCPVQSNQVSTTRLVQIFPSNLSLPLWRGFSTSVCAAVAMKRGTGTRVLSSSIARSALNEDGVQRLLRYIKGDSTLAPSTSLRADMLLWQAWHAIVRTVFTILADMEKVHAKSNGLGFLVSQVVVDRLLSLAKPAHECIDPLRISSSELLRGILESLAIPIPISFKELLQCDGLSLPERIRAFVKCLHAFESALYAAPLVSEDGSRLAIVTSLRYLHRQLVLLSHDEAIVPDLTPFESRIAASIVGAYDRLKELSSGKIGLDVQPLFELLFETLAVSGMFMPGLLGAVPGRKLTLHQALRPAMQSKANDASPLFTELDEALAFPLDRAYPVEMKAVVAPAAPLNSLLLQTYPDSCLGKLDDATSRYRTSTHALPLLSRVLNVALGPLPKWAGNTTCQSPTSIFQRATYEQGSQFSPNQLLPPFISVHPWHADGSPRTESFNRYDSLSMLYLRPQGGSHTLSENTLRVAMLLFEPGSESKVDYRELYKRFFEPTSIHLPASHIRDIDNLVVRPCANRVSSDSRLVIQNCDNIYPFSLPRTFLSNYLVTMKSGASDHLTDAICRVVTECYRRPGTTHEVAPLVYETLRSLVIPQLPPLHVRALSQLEHYDLQQRTITGDVLADAMAVPFPPIPALATSFVNLRSMAPADSVNSVLNSFNIGIPSDPMLAHVLALIGELGTLLDPYSVSSDDATTIVRDLARTTLAWGLSRQYRIKRSEIDDPDYVALWEYFNLVRNYNTLLEWLRLLPSWSALWLAHELRTIAKKSVPIYSWVAAMSQNGSILEKSWFHLSPLSAAQTLEGASAVIVATELYKLRLDKHITDFGNWIARYRNASIQLRMSAQLQSPKLPVSLPLVVEPQHLVQAYIDSFIAEEDDELSRWIYRSHSCDPIDFVMKLAAFYVSKRVRHPLLRRFNDLTSLDSNAFSSREVRATVAGRILTLALVDVFHTPPAAAVGQLLVSRYPLATIDDFERVNGILSDLSDIPANAQHGEIYETWVHLAQVPDGGRTLQRALERGLHTRDASNHSSVALAYTLAVLHTLERIRIGTGLMMLQASLLRYMKNLPDHSSAMLFVLELTLHAQKAVIESLDRARETTPYPSPLAAAARLQCAPVINNSVAAYPPKFCKLKAALHALCTAEVLVDKLLVAEAAMYCHRASDFFFGLDAFIQDVFLIRPDMNLSTLAAKCVRCAPAWVLNNRLMCLPKESPTTSTIPPFDSRILDLTNLERIACAFDLEMEARASVNTSTSHSIPTIASIDLRPTNLCFKPVFNLCCTYGGQASEILRAIGRSHKGDISRDIKAALDMISRLESANLLATAQRLASLPAAASERSINTELGASNALLSTKDEDLHGAAHSMTQRLDTALRRWNQWERDLNDRSLGTIVVVAYDRQSGTYTWSLTDRGNEVAKEFCELDLVPSNKSTIPQLGVSNDILDSNLDMLADFAMSEEESPTVWNKVHQAYEELAQILNDEMPTVGLYKPCTVSRKALVTAHYLNGGRAEILASLNMLSRQTCTASKRIAPERTPEIQNWGDVIGAVIPSLPPLEGLILSVWDDELFSGERPGTTLGSYLRHVLQLKQRGEPQGASSRSELIHAVNQDDTVQLLSKLHTSCSANLQLEQLKPCITNTDVYRILFSNERHSLSEVYKPRLNPVPSLAQLAGVRALTNGLELLTLELMGQRVEKAVLGNKLPSEVSSDYTTFATITDTLGYGCYAGLSVCHGLASILTRFQLEKPFDFAPSILAMQTCDALSDRLNGLHQANVMFKEGLALIRKYAPESDIPACIAYCPLVPISFATGVPGQRTNDWASQMLQSFASLQMACARKMDDLKAQYESVADGLGFDRIVANVAQVAMELHDLEQAIATTVGATIIGLDFSRQRSIDVQASDVSLAEALGPCDNTANAWLPHLVEARRVPFATMGVDIDFDPSELVEAVNMDPLRQHLTDLPPSLVDINVPNIEEFIGTSDYSHKQPRSEQGVTSGMEVKIHTLRLSRGLRAKLIAAAQRACDPWIKERQYPRPASFEEERQRMREVLNDVFQHWNKSKHPQALLSYSSSFWRRAADIFSRISSYEASQSSQSQHWSNIQLWGRGRRTDFLKAFGSSIREYEEESVQQDASRDAHLLSALSRYLTRLFYALNEHSQSHEEKSRRELHQREEIEIRLLMNQLYQLQGKREAIANEVRKLKEANHNPNERAEAAKRMAMLEEEHNNIRNAESVVRQRELEWRLEEASLNLTRRTSRHVLQAALTTSAAALTMVQGRALRLTAQTISLWLKHHADAVLALQGDISSLPRAIQVLQHVWHSWPIEAQQMRDHDSADAEREVDQVVDRLLSDWGFLDSAEIPSIQALTQTYGQAAVDAQVLAPTMYIPPAYNLYIHVPSFDVFRSITCASGLVRTLVPQEDGIKIQYADATSMADVVELELKSAHFAKPSYQDFLMRRPTRSTMPYIIVDESPLIAVHNMLQLTPTHRFVPFFYQLAARLDHYGDPTHGLPSAMTITSVYEDASTNTGAVKFVEDPLGVATLCPNWRNAYNVPLYVAPTRIPVSSESVTKTQDRLSQATAAYREEAQHSWRAYVASAQTAISHALDADEPQAGAEKDWSAECTVSLPSKSLVSFYPALERLVARITLDHPFQTLPVLEALRRGAEIPAASMGKYVLRAQTGRLAAVTRLLSRLRQEQNIVQLWQRIRYLIRRLENLPQDKASAIGSESTNDGTSFTVFQSIVELGPLLDTKCEVGNANVIADVIQAYEMLFDRYSNQSRYLNRGSRLPPVEDIFDLHNWREKTFVVDITRSDCTKQVSLTGEYFVLQQRPAHEAQPFQYSQYSCAIPTISKFLDAKPAGSGVTRPLVITTLSTDGAVRKHLLKAVDDLRQDSVIQQFFELANTLLSSSVEEECSLAIEDNDQLDFSNHTTTPERRHLHMTTLISHRIASTLSALAAQRIQAPGLRMRCYHVVAINPCLGLVEWVSNTTSLAEILLDPRRGAYARLAYKGQAKSPQDWTAELREAANAVQRAQLSARQYGPSDELKEALAVQLEIFKASVRDLPPVLDRVFAERWADLTDLLARRATFARSLGVSSLAGYVVGLGDRHLQNILFDNDSGEVVHIDLGVAFNLGRLLRCPEIVPFRLTRCLLDGMGPILARSVFPFACQYSLNRMQAEKDIILTIFEVFLHDPLFKWSMDTKSLENLSTISSDDFRGKGLAPTRSASVRAELALKQLKLRLLGHTITACSMPAPQEFLQDYAYCLDLREANDDETKPDRISNQVKRLLYEASNADNLSRMFVGWQPHI